MPITIDYETVRAPLDELLDTMDLRLMKDWGWRVGGEENLMCIKGYFHVTRAAYGSIVYLLTSKNKDGTQNPSWRPERALAVAPITRTILDAAFNVVALFDGPIRSRIENFRRAGWRDMKKEQDTYRERFSSLLEYDQGIKARDKFIDDWGREIENDLGITRRELEDTEWWPYPSQLVKSNCHLNPPLSKDRLDFLKILYKWFYPYLSSTSHLSWPGMRDRAWFFFASPATRARQIDEYVSRQLPGAWTALIFFISELQIGMSYSDLDGKLKTAWAALYSEWPDAKAVYDLRYARILGSLP